MPSSSELPPDLQGSSRRTVAEALRVWNRDLHYYLGLYLLLFVWLFAFTGLLLNHSQWKFAEFWENRKQSGYERTIVPLEPAGDLARARDLMKQLGVVGEIDWTSGGNDGTKLDFRVSRPGQILEVQADLTRQRAKVREIRLNGWGVARILHTFTGVRIDDNRNQRDWVVTQLWALSMDAVAAGLIIMVLGSVYMWFDSGRRRITGTAVLTLGFLSCGWFCFGLRWF